MSSAAARGGGSGQNLSGALILGARSPLLEGAGCHRRAARVWRRRAAAPGLRAIVIGKRGEDADFASGHLGSNLERIVRASKVPVFVASRAFQPITKVLVAYDGSPSAMKAVERMSKSAVFEGLEITLLYVDNGSGPIGSRMDDAVLALGSAGLSATARTVQGEPEEALQDIVASEGFGLLVMGAYGHSRIRSLIIGSTTTAMVQAVKIPVLLYR